MNHGANLTGVAQCPQCGIANPLLAFRSAMFEPDTGSTNIFGWVSYQCSSCHNLVTANGIFHRSAQQQFLTIVLQTKPIAISLVPATDTIPDELPDRARTYLAQANSSLAAPDGAVMLAGSAVDAMLKAKGYGNGSLYERIKKAADDHLITEDMATWAHAVRLESNKPRHADLDEPHSTTDGARQSIEFAKALGEFLFVLPARIAKGIGSSSMPEKVGTENGF